MEMGERIKKLRLEKGMTLEELGNKVGVGKSTVRKWETGLIENMRRDKVIKLARALGCTIEYLYGLEAEKSCRDDSEVLESDTSILPVESKRTVDYFENALDCKPAAKLNTAERRMFERLLAYYTLLTDIGKKEAEKRVEELTYVSKYVKDPQGTNSANPHAELNAAHVRTDKPITDADVKHDDDIMDDEDF